MWGGEGSQSTKQDLQRFKLGGGSYIACLHLAPGITAPTRVHREALPPSGRLCLLSRRTRLLASQNQRTCRRTRSSIQSRLRSTRTSHCTSDRLHAPRGRKHSTAGNAWLPIPRSAGSRCGHRRRTRILVETVVEAVVKPNGFVETVSNVTRG